MKKKFFLSILTITLLGLLLSYGCGGGDGITQPSSIPNTSDSDNLTQENSGYLRLKVIWPQSGAEGKMLFTSGEETLTESMPADAKDIKVTIRSDENDLNSVFEHGLHIFHWTEGEDSQEALIGPIPTVEVTVRAEVYTEAIPEDGKIPQGLVPVSMVQKQWDIYVGENELPLNMGDYFLRFENTPWHLIVIPDFKSPDFELLDEGDVTTTLSVESPDEYDVRYREIEFEILKYPGEEDISRAILQVMDETGMVVEEGEKVRVTTDEAGKCNFHIKANTEVEEVKDVPIEAKVLAKYPRHIDDFVYTQQFYIQVDSNITFEEHFEDPDDPNYPPPGTLRYGAPYWWSGSTDYSWFIELTGEVEEGLTANANNKLDSTGAGGSNVSLQVYSPLRVYSPFGAVDGGIYHIGPGAKPGFRNINVPYELRFWVKTGSETYAYPGVPGTLPRHTRSVIHFNDSLTIGYSVITGEYAILQGYLYNSYRPADGTAPLGGTTGWTKFRLQYVPNHPDTGKAKYYIYVNDSTTPVAIVDYDRPTADGIGFNIISTGGSVWYDEIEMYHFAELPYKTGAQ